MGSAPARRRPPVHYDYPSCLCTKFVDQLYFGLLREAWPALLDRFLKKRREKLSRRCRCERFVLLGSEEVCRVDPDERGQRALNSSEFVKIREAAGATIKRVRALEAAGAERSSKRDEYGAGSGAG
jgi:hypothetical protein